MSAGALQGIGWLCFCGTEVVFLGGLDVWAVVLIMECAWFLTLVAWSLTNWE